MSAGYPPCPSEHLSLKTAMVVNVFDWPETCTTFEIVTDGSLINVVPDNLPPVSSPFKNLLLEAAEVVNVFNCPKDCTTIVIVTDGPSTTVVPNTVAPVTSLISLDYESSGEESDIWELENGPVGPVAAVLPESPPSLPSGPAQLLPCPASVFNPALLPTPPDLFEETNRVENLSFAHRPGSSLDEGKEFLSDYLQTG